MSNNSHSSIEQFIRQNRAAFDHGDPHPGVWAKVEKQLHRLPEADHLERFIWSDRALFDSAEPSGHLWTAIEQALDARCTAGADPLEAFIHTHRENFDADTPDLRVWAAIEQALPTAREAKVVRVHWHRSLLRIAASIALLVCGIGIGLWYAGQHTNTPGMALSEVSSEYAELEQYYQRDISAKQEKLASFASYRDESVTEDLQQMDQIMNDLRQELANVPPGNREQVVRAMIENYKAKAAILERVLGHLQQQQPATTNNSSKHEVDNI